MVFAAQLLLEANLDISALGLDIENAFNEVVISKILEKLWEGRQLRQMW